MPGEYVEMVLLPQRGWSYSELKRLSIAERHLLMAMLEIEASVPQPKR